MNIGSIELFLLKVGTQTATYESEHGAWRLQVATGAIRQNSVVPPKIEIKVWVESAVLAAETT